MNGALPTAMARINGAFAARFNSSSGHVGHVFQDRYKSVPIDEERYLLEVVRYIHNNPETAHVCRAEDYKWSSYHEYVGVPGYATTALILKRVGGRRGFKQFCQERGNPRLRMRCNLERDEATFLEIAKDAVAPHQLSTLAGLPKRARDACLNNLRDIGFSLKQIERLTGIGKSTVYRATRDVS